MGVVEKWRARPRPCKARQKKQKEHERRQHETPPHPKGNIESRFLMPARMPAIAKPPRAMRPHQTIASTRSILPVATSAKLEWLIYSIKRCLVYKVTAQDKVASLEYKPDQRRNLNWLDLGR